MQTIEPMNTLENFGYREMSMLIDLLTAYTHANSTHEGKYYSCLPATWYDKGVYLDFNTNTGEVFLSNADYQALTLTEYGVAMFYITSYYGNDGTLFDLCDSFIENACNNDDVLPISDWSRWNKEDTNYLYHVLSLDLDAFLHTTADLTDCYKVKELIIKAFLLDGLQDTLSYLKNDGDDWETRLHSDDWWLSDSAIELFTQCLATSGFENEIHGDNYEKWIDFLRSSLISLTN